MNSWVPLLKVFVFFLPRATHNLFMLVNRHLRQNTVIELTEKQLEKVMPLHIAIECFPRMIAVRIQNACFPFFDITDSKLAPSLTRLRVC